MWINTKDSLPEKGDIRYAKNDILIFIALHIENDRWKFIYPISIFQFATCAGLPQPGQEVNVTAWAQLPNIEKHDA